MPIRAVLTADNSDLRRGTEEARGDFRRMGAEAESTSRQLKAVGNAFDGSRIEGAALRAVRGVEQIGGVTRLTGQELTALEKKVTSAVDKFRAMGAEVSPSIQKVARDIAHVRALEEDLARSADKATSALQNQAQQATRTSSALRGALSGDGLKAGGSALLSGLGIGVGAGAGLAALTSIGAAIADIAADGAAMAPLEQSFERLQGGADNANRELQKLRTSTRGLVSDTDLMRQSNQATQLQLTKMGVDMGTLAGAAVKLGRAVGNDATTSIDNLIGALGRGSTEVLDNLGITLKVAEAHEIYADRIHKTVAELTDQEKKQAFVTIGLERAVAASEALGAQELTVAEQATRITTALGDMAAGMVSSGNQSVTLAGQLGGVADAIERIRNAQPGEVGDLIAGMMDRAGQKLRQASEDATKNAPWYLKALAELGVAPARAAGSAAQAAAPFVGDPDFNRGPRRGRDISLPRSATDSTSDIGSVAELNAAREALGRLTAAQREAIASAKELGKTNKQAAQEAGTTEAVVRLYEAHIDAAKRATAEASKLRAELDKLTGADLIGNAVTLAGNLEKVGLSNVLPKALPQLSKQLIEAHERAEQLADQFAESAAQLGPKGAAAARQMAEEFRKAAAQIKATLDKIEIPNKAIPNIENLLNLNTIGFQARDAIAQAQRNTGSNSAFGGQINSTNPLANTLVEMPGRIYPNIRSASLATQEWRVNVRGVAQAFAQLATIAGPSMDKVTRSVGTTLASLDAAGQLVDSLAEALPKLGLTEINAQGQTVQSGRGRFASGALGSLTTGAALGSTTSNPYLAAALGGGGGLATGALAGLTGASLGATAGIGAAAAIYMAWRNRQAEKKALSEQRAQVIAAAGGYEQFQEAVEDAGFSFEYFLSLFNSNDADVFTDAMNRLNTSMAEQRTRADKLVKSLAEVARVQGVISPQQWAQIRNTEGDDESAAAIVEFAAQQRAQAEQGLVSAIAAINQQASLTDAEVEELTKGITDAAERQRVIEAALKRKATETLDRFGAGAQAAASGLFVAFSEAIAQGESALSVLARLAPSIKTLNDLYQRAGKTPGAGFQQLQVDADIATNPQTAPAVQMAQGLGQALAGFANSGLLSPELFGELANGIGEAYKQLELMGKGGLEAARLMQPSLQAIWQMTQDTPQLRDELDDTTLALLDFAEKNGLVGDKFRPAIDRMIDAMNRLLDKLDDLVEAINDVPGIRVPVTYEETNQPPAGATPGGGSDGGGSAGDGTYGGGADGDPTTPFAIGGIVTKPTKALIGEAGPEAVVPLAQYRALVAAAEDAKTVRLSPVSPWQGAASSGSGGRIGSGIESAATRILSTLDDVATGLQAWQRRISDGPTLGGVFNPIPDVRTDEPAGDVRAVSPGVREAIVAAPSQEWWRMLEDVARIRPDDPAATVASMPEKLREVSDDWWRDRDRIRTDEERDAAAQELIAATGGQWTGEPTGPSKVLDTSASAIVPLSRGGVSSAPIQITVVSQIDGYEAARAVTRHQPDVYRTYGAA